MRHIPNIISFARILLVFPTTYYLYTQHYLVALVIFFIAGVSDGVDGFLARRFGWQSKLGAMLDPLGDKFLMLTTYFMLGFLGHVSVALVAVVIGRDLVILAGAITYRVKYGHVEMQPMLVSKLNTACQILLVLLFLYSLASLPYAKYITPTLLDIMVYIVFATTIASGIAYVSIWWQKAIEASQEQKQHAG